MKPVFKIIANHQQDITPKVNDRLLSLNITDKAGIEYDDFEIELDDRDNKIDFPNRDVVLDISLGYDANDLFFMGSYKVDEVEIKSPPQSMIIRGKPASMTGSLKNERRCAFENKPFNEIVQIIAERNNLTPLCEITDIVKRIDQINESDMHFIQRLANEHNATSTIKDNKLIVISHSEKSNNNGETQNLTILKSDVSNFSITYPDRANLKKSTATYADNNTGEIKKVEIENPNASNDNEDNFTDRHIYPDEETAKSAAQANLAEAERQTVRGRLQFFKGRGDVFAEQNINLQGFKNGVDGEYCIESVNHTFNQSGWLTSIEFNAGKNGKAKVGRK